MKKCILFIVAAFSLLLMSPLYADECMEGDCDNGYGTGFTEDNKVYEGEWKDGLPNGRGTLYISRGKSIEGLWEKGELVKEEKQIKQESKNNDNE